MRNLSWRTWLSIVTFVIIAIVLYTSRHELQQAWGLLQEVNLWLLLGLLIPLQFLSYHAMGEVIFSYLRSQGQGTSISPFKFARLSLEMNFVNHVLPSAGVSGASYMGWRLKHYGISVSKSTSAQLVRIVAVSGGFAIVLAIAVLSMLLDGSLNRWVSLLSAALVAAAFIVVAIMIFILEREKTMTKMARGMVKITNGAIRVLTLGRVPKKISSAQPLALFFGDIQADYRTIRRKKKLLLKPLLWGVIFSAADVAMFYAAFVALGHPVNPAPIAVAFGLAGAASFFMVTPGGAGLYEVVMIGFLTLSGVDPRVGIAAIVLTRVVLMLGTIIAGYYFYQQAIMKHGRKPKSSV